MMTANFSTWAEASLASSSVMPLSVEWRSFKSGVDQILSRLRDAHIRLTLVSIAVSDSFYQPSTAQTLLEATRVSLPVTDPVGLLANGNVCALLLGTRPPGGLGDIIVVERFIRRLLLALSFRSGLIRDETLLVGAVHCWAGEIDDAQDLIDGLDLVSIQEIPAFSYADKAAS